MRRLYLYFLISSTTIFIILPFLINKNGESWVIRKNKNNLEKIIEDSITPPCNQYERDNLESIDSNIKSIQILIPKSREWTKNLVRAKISSEANIIDKYKKRFNAKVKITKLKSDCILSAKIRLHGDYKDHIIYKNNKIFSSLDVKLENGNINGIINFKLFLPHTRNGDSEIITTTILKKMGYVAPRSQYINVNFNGEKLKMILQEKASKEMLESNNLRETLILESDESLLWKLRPTKRGVFNGMLFPRAVNEKWISRNLINQEIALKGLDIFSKAIIEQWNRGENKEQSYSDTLLSNFNKKSNIKLSTFRVHIFSMNALHGLYNANRKFYFDPFENAIYPIYYDGNSSIRNIKPQGSGIYKYAKNKLLIREISQEDIKKAAQELNNIDLIDLKNNLERYGVFIKIKELKNIRKILLINQNLLSSHIDNQISFNFKKNALDRYVDPSVKYGIVFGPNKTNYNLCDPDSFVCKTKILNQKEIINLLNGEFIHEGINYYYLGKEQIFDEDFYILNSNLNRKESNDINPNNQINIRKIGNPLVYIDDESKIIKILINKANEKVIIYESELNSWKIDLKANYVSTINKLDSRVDSSLLTGLITIKDSSLDKVEININGGYLEDSLNVIRSNGNIKYISVDNSFQDAIDFDFSNLNIDRIDVNNAGNDCIDFSGGRYFIKSANLNKCNDKGISVGEKSIVQIDEIRILDSKIALVSKDSSELLVKKGSLKRFNICVAAYIKKDEYGPSKVTIPNLLCPKNKEAIQIHSILQKI